MMLPLLVALSAPAWAAEPDLQACPAVTERDNPLTVFTGGRDGWLYRLGADIEVQYEMTPRGQGILEELNARLAARGTTLILVRFPPRGLQDPGSVVRGGPIPEDWTPEAAEAAYAAHLDYFREAGIEVLDVLAIMRATDGFYFKRDNHWTHAGSAAVARALAERIRAMPGGAALPHAEFTVRESQTLERKGSLRDVVEKHCGPLDVAMHDHPLRHSVAVAGDAEALLGEAPPPEIAVVGASNVNFGNTDGFFFAGALRQELQTDVDNAGVARAGPEAPIIEYLRSDSFQDHPPKVLIWVSYAHHSLVKIGFLRRMMGALEPPCEAPLAQATVQMGTDERQPLFDFPPGVNGWDYHLELKTTDPELVAYDLWYTDQSGESERMPVRINPWMPQHGLASAQLLPRTSDFKSVAVERKRGKGEGSLTVHLCKRAPSPSE